MVKSPLIQFHTWMRLTCVLYTGLHDLQVLFLILHTPNQFNLPFTKFYYWGEMFIRMLPVCPLNKISISDIIGYGWFICSITWRTAYVFYGYPKLRGPQRRTKLNLREYWTDFFTFYFSEMHIWLYWNAVTLKCMRDFKQWCTLKFLILFLFYMMPVYQFKIYVICIFKEGGWSFDMNLFLF